MNALIQASLDLGELHFVTLPLAPSVEPSGLYLEWPIQSGVEVATAVQQAAQAYHEAARDWPNAVLLHENDWRALGVGIGSVVWGCRVRVSFFCQQGTLKVAAE